MRHFNKLINILVFSSLFFALPVCAGEPTSQLSATIDQFVTILVNTPVAQLRASGLPENAMASLGRHWQALDLAEQQEFVDAFTQRLLRGYGRSVRGSGDDKIQYEREVRKGNYASVETKIVSGSGDELPIDYELHDVDGQWKVYDMVIDHISIVTNYRAQFERVITKSSLKDLLQKMKQLDS